MILKLAMQHWVFKLYKVYINDDPGLTMTYFKERSNKVTSTFYWGRLLQSLLMGKLEANDQIDRRFMFLQIN